MARPLLLLWTLAITTSAYASKGPSLENKLGQLLLIGFRGLTLAPTDPIAQDLHNGTIGGVILFDYDLLTKRAERNIQSPAQVKKLVRDLKAQTKDTIFVSIDQEGGKVNRLKEKYGFPPSKTAEELAALPDAELERETARLAGNLADLGFNLNFAPDVDLNLNPANPVIGKFGRSFSADPDVVIEKAKVYIEAHRRAGVRTVLKHFPGHGSSQDDSHLDFVDVSQTWDKKELEPYEALAKAGLVDAVMTAHVFNDALDAKYPATLSPTILKTFLRKDIGFDGVVFSDDMQMGAIAKHYGLETAIQLALEADVDVLCFGNNVSFDDQIGRKAHAILKKLVKDGKVSESRIDRSYRRIRDLKARL